MVMLISTRNKIVLARLAYLIVIGFRRLIGRDYEAQATRFGIRWVLDLREGIDLSIYLFGRFEPETVRAYRQLIRPGDVVADIGANMGAHSLWLARYVGETGKVLAFEPTAAAFFRLQRNVNSNPELSARINARQIMLAAAPEQLLEPTIYASWRVDGKQEKSAHPLHLGVAVSTEGAKSLTFDDAVDGESCVSLIKLDVDGHEYDVLRGAQQILKRDRPKIIMELAPYTIRERGQDIKDLVSLLRSFGYSFRHLSGRPVKEAELTQLREGSSLNVIAAVD
jgi:FkbM family methyltransferase